MSKISNVKVLVNAYSSHIGGGRTVVLNFLKTISGADHNHDIHVLTRADHDFVDACKAQGFKTLVPPRIFENAFGITILYIVLLPLYLLIRRYCTLLNFADIPIMFHGKQIMYYDWPWALYRNSYAWSLLTGQEKLLKRTRLCIFGIFARFVDIWLVQTNVVKERLLALGVKGKFVLTPNSTTVVTTNSSSKWINSSLPPGSKYGLCLTSYYVHKNIEILIKVALLLKARGAKIVFVTTLDRQSTGYFELYNSIHMNMVSEHFVNLGHVNLEDIPNLYRRVDFMILPTLLETYTGTYVEAGTYGCPILTSDLDFSREICGDSATFFDPLDASSINGAIDKILLNDNYRNSVVAKAKERFHTSVKWEEISSTIVNQL